VTDGSDDDETERRTEEIRLRVALGVALFALDYMASKSCPDPKRVAEVALRLIRDKYGYTPENT
jgi:hypothetical protein